MGECGLESTSCGRTVLRAAFPGVSSPELLNALLWAWSGFGGRSSQACSIRRLLCSRALAAAIERLVRYVRYGASGVIEVDAVAAREPFAHQSPDDLRDACQWLIQQEQGEWIDEPAGTFRLFEIPKPRGGGRRGKAPSRRSMAPGSRG